MAIKDITADRLRELFHYDPDTGIFTRRVASYRRNNVGAVVGTSTGHYLQFMVDRNLVLLHRLAWLYMTGDWPKSQIDHIDGNPFNNRFSNLRDVPRHGNQQNVKTHKRNLLGVKNVSYDPRGRMHYRVSLSANGQTVYDERFKTLEEAKERAASARARFHPYYARG